MSLRTSCCPLAFAVLPFIVAGCGGSKAANSPALEVAAIKVTRLEPGKKDDQDYTISLAFSPDGTVLLQGCQNSLRAWQMPAGLPLTFDHGGWEELEESCRHAAFSPDGKRLATCHYISTMGFPNSCVQIWAVEGHKLRKTKMHYGPEADAFHLAFCPDGSTLVAGNNKDGLTFWDADTGKEKLSFRGGVAATWTPDGKTVISMSHYGAIRRWRAGTNELLSDPKEKRADFMKVTAVAFTTDARLVAISDQHVVRIKDTHTNKTLHDIELTGDVVNPTFSPDGKILAIGGSFYDTATGKQLAWHTGEGAFTPDGQTYITVRDLSLHLHDTSSFLREHSKPVVSPAPPEIAVQAELIANQDTYELDLGGLSAEEVSDLAAPHVPHSPKVDLTLKLRNTGSQTVRIWRSHLDDNPKPSPKGVRTMETHSHKARLCLFFPGFRLTLPSLELRCKLS